MNHRKQWGNIAPHESVSFVPKSFKSDFNARGGLGECCIFNEFGGGGCGPCSKGGAYLPASRTLTYYLQ